MRSKWILIALVLLSFLVTACSTDTTYKFEDTQPINVAATELCPLTDPAVIDTTNPELNLWVKVDSGTGSVAGDYGSFNWSGNTLVFNLNAGYELEFCLKYSTNTDYQVASGAGNMTTGTSQDISHMAWRIVKVPEDFERECQEETAWAGYAAGAGKAWWFVFDTHGPSSQTIYAGKKATDGTVTWDSSTDTLTIDLGSWELQDDSEAVKVEGYDVLPTKRPAAGKFTLYKGTSLTISGDGSRYYAIHLDAQLCE